MGVHWNTKKTSCKHGHPYTSENTYVYTRKDTNRSERSCKICLKASADRLLAIKRGELRSV
jgi:hypothetical protein